MSDFHAESAKISNRSQVKSEGKEVNDSAINRLLNFRRHLEVWKLPGGFIAVAFAGVEVKDGYFLKGEYGAGTTFEDACTDYLKKISGKTLVYYDWGTRMEATVL